MPNMCFANDLEACGIEAECYNQKTKGSPVRSCPLSVHLMNGTLNLLV